MTPGVRFCLRHISLVLLVATLEFSPGAAEPQPGDANWNQLRRQALNRPRRLIFNNDGNEPVVLCKQPTVEELLKYRTAPLVGSQVDSIFYCTWSSGFGMFTHRTKVGQVFNTREGRYTNNLAQAFLDGGIDPLQVMVDFGRQHQIEVFWSFRVNDTHDGSRTDYGPVMFRTNTLKRAHPDWLIGSQNQPPKYGAWSAMDFSVAEVRDLAFRFCQEICQNYAVDGIELDFFRHAFWFKCSGRGEPCGAAELGQMTSLLRRVRAMTEEVGRTRGRPLLLAIRVPDSIEYCRFIGLDLEVWLAGGLVDLLVVGGYTQLNSWIYSVALGHKHGVKVYPSLDESRVRDERARALRSSLAAYRGRALNVWASGADGVYLFNFFDPLSPLWRELGDPALLRQRDRDYFSSVRGVGSLPVPHQKFIRVPTLNPGSPLPLKPGKPVGVEFVVGEVVNAAPAPGNITLRTSFKGPPQFRPASAILNGEQLDEPRVAGQWIEYSLQAKTLRRGVNVFEVNCGPQETGTVSLLDLYLVVRYP